MTPPYLPQRLEVALTSLLSRCCIWQVAIILHLIELSECLRARSQVGLKEWFQWVKDTWVKLFHHSLAFYSPHFTGQTLILSQLSGHAHIFLIQKVCLPLTPDHRFQLYFHSLSVVLCSWSFFSQVFKISQFLQFLITVIVLSRLLLQPGPTCPYTRLLLWLQWHYTWFADCDGLYLLSEL